HILRQKEQPWVFTPDVFFENTEALRAEVAGLLNTKPENMAIIPSVGYGITTAANILKTRVKPGKILILDEQFPSNVYPWRELEADGFIVDTLKRDLGRDLCDQILERVDAQTSIVAVPNVHWSDGHYLDLVRLSGELKSDGIPLLVDAVQSTGILPTDLDQMKPDFLVTGFYKWMLGPYGLGCMYVDEKYFDGEPIEQAWMNREGSEKLHLLTNYTDEIKKTAERFDQGGKSFVNIVLAAESARLLRQWGTQAMSDHAREITGFVGRELEASGYGVLDETVRCPHILGVLPRKGPWPEDIGAQLFEREVVVAQRGERLRISPNAYNTIAEAQKLVSTLMELT
ncbi:MAG: aminotransferase class V-fold PLP-dependent enzyme, partial [Pseudomonadota bacterium]